MLKLLVAALAAFVPFAALAAFEPDAGAVTQIATSVGGLILAALTYGFSKIVDTVKPKLSEGVWMVIVPVFAFVLAWLATKVGAVTLPSDWPVWWSTFVMTLVAMLGDWLHDREVWLKEQAGS